MRRITLIVGMLSGCMSAAASAAPTYQLTTLATFNRTNGQNPYAGLIADSGGNLYGATAAGGANLHGNVFEVVASSHALTTLATFNGTNGDSADAGLIVDASGNLFGTTAQGGANGYGTVFEVAAGTHALTTLATFNVTNGAFPEAGLIVDVSGNLYGTTWQGGANGDGTIFEVANDANHTLSTLVTFNGANGANPLGDLIADSSGNFYGTTRSGGANNRGTVFQLAAGTHILSTLATFNGSNGNEPHAGLIADTSGNFYGTTAFGGANNKGTVFEVANDLNHTLSTLVAFDGANGSSPYAGVLVDASGNIYGTTSAGGANNKGTVFKVAAGTHALITLATFNGTNGANPRAGLHRNNPSLPGLGGLG